MHALVTVVLTLAGLGGILFGTDYLDRRCTGGERPGPGRCPSPRTVSRAGALVGRPAPGCSYGRGGAPGRSRERVVHGRIAGPHGPIAVPARRGPLVAHLAAPPAPGAAPGAAVAEAAPAVVPEAP